MIYIGSDHAGFALKKEIKQHLESKDKVIDLGVFAVEPPADYPDIDFEVAEKVNQTKGAKGILVCGTGIGMCMAANKMLGIRAANCESVGTVEMSRKHNDSNILCLGGRVLETKMAFEMVDMFLNTAFENEERHVRRVEKMNKRTK